MGISIKDRIKKFFAKKNVGEDKKVFETHNTIKIKLDHYGILPRRAHPNDAGLDLFAERDEVVKAHNSAVFYTGVHIELPENTVGILKSKSGLNMHNDITSGGVIDQGFSGEIRVKLYNNGDADYEVLRGDKITQLIILPCNYPKPNVVDKIEGGERGNAGFGSTGKR